MRFTDRDRLRLAAFATNTPRGQLAVSNFVTGSAHVARTAFVLPKTAN